MIKKTIYSILGVLFNAIAFLPTVAGLYAINLLVWYPLLSDDIIGSWRFNLTLGLLFAAWLLAEAFQTMFKALAKTDKTNV